MSPNVRTFTVSDEEAGDRIDRYLSLKLEDLSRSRFKALVKEGQAAANGVKILEPNYRVKQGEQISIVIPEPEDPVPKPENIPLTVVYEDDDVIVIDKPAGMVVHPAAGNWSGTLVNALIAHCGDSISGVGGVRRPGIVHRLDKETTGLMVVAKNDRAHAGLSEQFAAHGRDGRMFRRYQALVWGVPERKKGTVEAPLGRKQANRQKMAVLKEGAGKHAVTHYEVLQVLSESARASLIACILETGRTHQIRVHMAHIGHPLLGDAVYGAHFAASARTLSDGAQARLADLGRQALHAGELGFEHPLSGQEMRFQSPLPDDMAALLTALRKG
ncbi:MAG: RluA family pseudouridine synthase [Pseudomonadota bacterium]